MKVADEVTEEAERQCPPFALPAAVARLLCQVLREPLNLDERAIEHPAVAEQIEAGSRLRRVDEVILVRP
jgi:hypothetical protein